MLIALVLVSFLLLILALITMPKRIYEKFQKKEFPGFWKRIVLVLADMLLFGISFAAVLTEPGEFLFGVSLSLEVLLVFSACFSGVLIMEAIQKKAPQKQKGTLTALTAGFLIAAVLFGILFLG